MLFAAAELLTNASFAAASAGNSLNLNSSRLDRQTHHYGCDIITSHHLCTHTSIIPTCLVGGDGDGCALGCPHAAGLRDSVACVHGERVVRVRPQLAHDDFGGLQAGLGRREEHVRAAGQAEVGAGVRAQAGVLSGRSPALEDPSTELDFSSHNPLVRLHLRAPALRLGLGDAAVLEAFLVPAPRLTDEALHAVTGIAATSQAARGGPLQNHRRLVHGGDELLWGRRRL